MYKSEIRRTLMQLTLVSGGAIENLIHRAQLAEPKIHSALVDLASATDPGMRKAVSTAQNALGTLNELLASIAPSAIYAELHDLNRKFDLALSDQPALEQFLRPGRQALGTLGGAVDVAFQQTRQMPALVGLLGPSIALGACYAHYVGVLEALTPTEDSGGEGESVSIEIDGIERLEAFAAYTGLLSFLASEARRALSEGDIEIDSDSFATPTPTHDIWIESVDSGSPRIEFKLGGDGKSLRLFLNMFRDVVRSVYRSVTTHGQALQALETLAYAKELGIQDPAVLKQLERAVGTATGKYADTFEDPSVVVSVEGQVVRDTSTLALPVLEDTSERPKNFGVLPPPNP